MPDGHPELAKPPGVKAQSGDADSDRTSRVSTSIRRLGAMAADAVQADIRHASKRGQIGARTAGHSEQGHNPKSWREDL